MSVPAAMAREDAHRALGQVAWRLLPAVPFVFILIAWMAGGAIFHPNKATLPPVGDVIEAVWVRTLDGELIRNIQASLWRLFLGASVGIITGIVGGFIAVSTGTCPIFSTRWWCSSTRSPASSGCR
jgi:ABC-type nitrate/sulfonate/bicarbonate transport system permease component